MSLFGIGRKREDATIHAIQLKVRAGTKPLPSPLIGAQVIAFSMTAEPREAIINSVRALRALGHDFEEVLPEGFSMPLSGWDSYVAQVWPEFKDEFPSQSEIAARLANGGVVFSPFAGFDSQ